MIKKLQYSRRASAKDVDPAKLYEAEIDASNYVIGTKPGPWYKEGKLSLVSWISQKFDAILIVDMIPDEEIMAIVK